MANSKITMLKLKTLMQYLAAGRSYAHICKQLNMGKSTLSDYRQSAIATGESFQALSQLDDAQLKALLQPPENEKAKAPHFLVLELYRTVLEDIQTGLCLPVCGRERHHTLERDPMVNKSLQQGENPPGSGKKNAGKHVPVKCIIFYL